MVVSPKELMEKIQQDEQEKVKRLERKIDESIRKSFGGQGSNYNFDEDCYDMPSSALDRLLDKYRVHGWSVQICCAHDPFYEGCKSIEFSYNADETKTK